MPRLTGYNSTTTAYSIRAQNKGSAKMYSLGPVASFNFLVPDDEGDELAAQLATLSGVTYQSGDSVEQAKLFFVVNALAQSNTAVHAAYAATAANIMTGTFTSPDVPRNIKCVFSAGYDGGNVTVSGTGWNDLPVTETFTGTASTTQTGSVMFKTVTGAVKTTVGTAGTVSIGTGIKLAIGANTGSAFGMLSVAAVAEAVTIDATNDSFQPTTAPDGAADFLLLVNI